MSKLNTFAKSKVKIKCMSKDLAIRIIIEISIKSEKYLD